MASYIRRRKFLATLLGGAAAWPLAARAQQGERVRRIGLLMGVADDREGQARVTALKQGLQELGWTDSRNIQIETRFGGADTGRIRAHAAELVALAPDVIVTHTTPVIRALRQATSSIPIVVAAVNDPVDVRHHVLIDRIRQGRQASRAGGDHRDTFAGAAGHPDGCRIRAGL